MALKFAWELEAWSLPGVGSFSAQVTSIPAIDVSWSDPKNEVGGGTFTIDPRYADLDSICDPDSDVETLIRVKVGSDYIYNFFARNRTDNYDDQGLTQISGPGLADILDHAIVYPYDYPDNPSNHPDWIFGSQQNGIRNPGFEEVPKFISNNTFEDGTTEPWVPGPLTTFENSSDQFKTGTQSLKVVPSVDDAGASLQIPVVPNSFHGVDVWVYCAGGGDMELAVSVPGDIKRPLYSATTPDTIVGTEIVSTTAEPVDDGTGLPELNIQYGSDIEDPDDPGFEGVVYVELRKTVTGAASWQHLVLHFWTGNNQTNVQVSVRARGHSNTFYIDDFGQFGNGVGLTGWELARVGAQTFQASLPITADVDNVNQETGNWCASITANRVGMGIKQTVTGIQPGHKYTVSARIKADAGVDIRLVVTDPSHNWIAGANDIGPPTVPGAYNTYSATFVMPDTWPGDSQQVAANEAVIVKIVMGDEIIGGNETFYVDSVELIPGEPAATIGDILDQLIQDAAVDHIADGRTTTGGAGHLAYLEYDFDASGDSALPVGSAWATPGNPSGLESVTIKRGISYLQLMEQIVARLGYDWRVIVSATPGFKLQVYNPNGGGVDLSGTVSLVTGKVGPSSLGLNGLNANVVFGEGKDRLFHEETDATDVTAYGRREVYTPKPEIIGADTLTSWVQARALVESGFKEGHRIELMDVSDFHPYIDFQVSDTITVDLGTHLSSRTLPVKAVTVSLTDDKAKFDVDVNTDPPPASAVPNIALAKILKQFRGIDDGFKFGGGAEARVDTSGATVPEGGGSGGALSIVVAASNASEESQAKADYTCDGTDDHVEIVQALNDLQYDNGSGSGGLVQLTEGDFYLDWNEVKLSESGIGYWQNDYASLRGVGNTTRIHPSSQVASAVRSTSQFGTVAVLIDNDVPFGEVTDLSFVDEPASGSDDTAYLRLASYQSNARNITFNCLDSAGAGTWPFIGILGNNRGVIQNINMLGQGWDDTDFEYLIACDNNTRYSIRGVYVELAGDDSAHDGVTVVSTTSETQIQGVYVYNSDACQVLGIRAGAAVQMSGIRYRLSAPSATAGLAAAMYMESTGTSSLLGSDWLFDSTTDPLIDFAHGLNLELSCVTATSMPIVVGITGGTFTSVVNIGAECQIGPVELTEGMIGSRIAGAVHPDGTATIGVALIDCDSVWVQSARFGGGTAFTDFVNVDSGCTDCVVVQNDSRSGGAITDNGTGTTTSLAGNL